MSTPEEAMRASFLRLSIGIKVPGALDTGLNYRPGMTYDEFRSANQAAT